MLEGVCYQCLMNEKTHCRDIFLGMDAAKAMGHCLPRLGRKNKNSMGLHPKLIYPLSLSLKDWKIYHEF